ncbi:MAG: hypothetical protein MUP55_03885 [Candidatus Aenigmarchaeota archaeon]|nr:hypothetical protein [Candidatus Aenigmarchaeota archaeon]
MATPDVVDKIMRYEDGEMTPDEQIDFFGELTSSGMVWKLQGHYGRMATALIDEGFIDRSGKVLKHAGEGHSYDRNLTLINQEISPECRPIARGIRRKAALGLHDDMTDLIVELISCEVKAGLKRM